MRVAMRRNGTLTYLHADHLGSTVLETNTSGTATANQKYCAYGNRRTASGSTQLCGTGNGLVTDHTFTGQKYDGTGLMYYNSRYYDPALGAFISPDTIVPKAENLFSYNRYMYTFGNPLKYSDPTGHFSDDEITTHFDCDDWNCVESNFEEGGSHAGMWGWLSLLKVAQDGDLVGIMGGYNDSGFDWQGRIGINNGKIMVSEVTGRVGDAQMRNVSASYVVGDTLAEESFATMALMGNWESNHYAMYTRHGGGFTSYNARATDCVHHDCVTQALDAGSTGAAALASGCLSTGQVHCATVAGGISTVLGGVGAVRTLTSYGQEGVTRTDVLVATMTAAVGGLGGSAGKGVVGLYLSVFQWGYDYGAANR